MVFKQKSKMKIGKSKGPKQKAVKKTAKQYKRNMGGVWTPQKVIKTNIILI